MSVSEVHQALGRAAECDLLDARQKAPKVRNLEEFLIHGVRYAFPAKKGSIVRGIPTAYAASPFNSQLVESTSAHPPVWPDPCGEVRGYAIEPLYKSAPQAALADQSLYELLALIDALRIGKARERNLAAKILHGRLSKNE